MSDSIYDVVHRYGLDRAQAAQLWDSAAAQPPAQWPQRLWRILAWVSALLLGAGLIFWVAAQWPQQTRLFKLYLLQAAVAVPVLTALGLLDDAGLLEVPLLISVPVLMGIYLTAQAWAHRRYR